MQVHTSMTHFYVHTTVLLTCFSTSRFSLSVESMESPLSPLCIILIHGALATYKFIINSNFYECFTTLLFKLPSGLSQFRLINTRTLFLTVLEASKSKIKAPTDLVSGENLHPFSQTMVFFALSSHGRKGGRGLSRASFIKSTNAFMRAPPS